MALKRIISIIPLWLLICPVFATHNRAGEITFRHIGGLKYEITVITYTEIGGNQADRPFLHIDWGDNSGPDSIVRSPNPPILTSSIKKNIYIKSHEYGGPGRYVVSVEDPNRNANIRNIPNSVSVPFYIESELIIDAFAGHNNSVKLLNPPIDFACVNSPFIHNPSAYDPDGDSLVFSLVASKGYNGVTIPGYQFPPAANSLQINPRTGELVWDHPTIIGEFNIAMLVKEYKNGIPVGSVLRDMQITVGPACEHDPPQISDVESICVEAGDTLDLIISAADTLDGVTRKSGDTVFLTASGGVFEVQNPASFGLTTTLSSHVRARFFWPTNCSNVRKTPYQVVYRAVDDGEPNLTSFKSIEIKVVAPAPENFTVIPVKNTAELDWDPTVCTNAVGYRIYRKLGSSGFDPDSCETGVPASTGFELLHTIEDIAQTSFVDDDNGKGLIIGLQYCYRVIAFFEDDAESYSSEEICIQLKKELPVITNVSVITTSLTEGVIDLAWSKPTEFDTSVYPGPYRYVIRRQVWNENFEVIDSSAININDTTYTDINLNTEDNEYSYIIDMYDLSQGRTFMGPSVAASSIYLGSLAQDNRLVLQWNEEVPWINRKYVLYKLNPVSGDFDFVDTVYTQSYTDDSLINGVEYCYKLESFGEYLVPGLIKPIRNLSQIHCNVPIDTVAPCPPQLTIETIDCESLSATTEGDPIDLPCSEGVNETLLRWTNPNHVCEDVDDVVEYRIYQKRLIDAPFSIIHTVNQPNDTSYTYISEDGSIAGCYYVTAVDSFGNESAFTDSICVDNCPIYRLPNVFTPGNNDGFNDLFQPFPYCFVESVNITIFNRWGQTVFETSDPDINWNGIDQFTGISSPEGVYFYVCQVREIRLAGLSTRKLKGVVHLMRTGEPTNEN